jgi:GT2 family glycosyltransferase
MSQVFVLIPTHNRKNILSNTLSQVLSQLDSHSVQVIVVDAGSTDNTKIDIQRLFPEVRIVDGDQNMWWTESINLGIVHIEKYANPGDRVIVMNDDVDLDPNALDSLIEASELQPNSIIGALQLLCDSEIEGESRVYFCGARYDFLLGCARPNRKQGTVWNRPESRFLETQYLFGRLLIIPWKAFMRGCRFDAGSFPQYLADEDFSLDAGFRGFKSIIDCKSIVYVNMITTARFSLSFFNNGLKGIKNSLTAFNSYYNFKQNWIFSKRYAQIPSIFMLFKYSRIFLSENLSGLIDKYRQQFLPKH